MKPNIQSPQDLANFINQRYVLFPKKVILFEVIDLREESGSNMYAVRFRKEDWREYEPVMKMVEEDEKVLILYDYPDTWSYTYVIRCGDWECECNC